jgi:hypothetical protein
LAKRCGGGRRSRKPCLEQADEGLDLGCVVWGVEEVGVDSEPAAYALDVPPSNMRGSTDPNVFPAFKHRTYVPQTH